MTKDVSEPQMIVPFEPPVDSTTLTDSDRLYITLYLRLLDADAAGVDWKIAARQILNLDPTEDCDHAKDVFDRFLSRAKWMTEIGYELLLKSSD